MYTKKKPQASVQPCNRLSEYSRNPSSNRKKDRSVCSRETIPQSQRLTQLIEEGQLEDCLDLLESHGFSEDLGTFMLGYLQQSGGIR